eukprot:CAMPEP_0174313148 /NCGR_PEP_ID=MMETSP0810-20121108/4784_1 /TAXON_ID=73025 ORGANISM="Eutreptiella gymnastica-like, Strain CCMP1594" /NCGR_SAMPLE_ID=MMETSP0810 /ASSEMBLY_ACC=CAM_ASM_000659 /LENGTH=120 /DNA_ID=CAMNT_0015421819 /DNA_START=1056 /DNA_END=1413 /DNA_ORIENTATION=-
MNHKHTDAHHFGLVGNLFHVLHMPQRTRLVLHFPLEPPLLNAMDFVKPELPAGQGFRIRLAGVQVPPPRPCVKSPALGKGLVQGLEMGDVHTHVNAVLQPLFGVSQRRTQENEVHPRAHG